MASLSVSGFPSSSSGSRWGTDPRTEVGGEKDRKSSASCDYDVTSNSFGFPSSQSSISSTDHVQQSTSPRPSASPSTHYYSTHSQKGRYDSARELHLSAVARSRSQEDKASAPLPASASRNPKRGCSNCTPGLSRSLTTITSVSSPSLHTAYANAHAPTGCYLNLTRLDIGSTSANPNVNASGRAWSRSPQRIPSVVVERGVSRTPPLPMHPRSPSPALMLPTSLSPAPSRRPNASGLSRTASLTPRKRTPTTPTPQSQVIVPTRSFSASSQRRSNSSPCSNLLYKYQPMIAEPPHPMPTPTTNTTNDIPTISSPTIPPSPPPTPFTPTIFTATGTLELPTSSPSSSPNQSPRQQPLPFARPSPAHRRAAAAQRPLECPPPSPSASSTNTMSMWVTSSSTRVDLSGNDFGVDMDVTPDVHSASTPTSTIAQAFPPGLGPSPPPTPSSPPPYESAGPGTIRSSLEKKNASSSMNVKNLHLISNSHTVISTSKLSSTTRVLPPLSSAQLSTRRSLGHARSQSHSSIILSSPHPPMSYHHHHSPHSTTDEQDHDQPFDPLLTICTDTDTQSILVEAPLHSHPEQLAAPQGLLVLQHPITTITDSLLTADPELEVFIDDAYLSPKENGGDLECPSPMRYARPSSRESIVRNDESEESDSLKADSPLSSSSESSSSSIPFITEISPKRRENEKPRGKRRGRGIAFVDAGGMGFVDLDTDLEMEFARIGADEHEEANGESDRGRMEARKMVTTSLEATKGKTTKKSKSSKHHGNPGTPPSSNSHTNVNINAATPSSSRATSKSKSKHRSASSASSISSAEHPYRRRRRTEQLRSFRNSYRAPPPDMLVSEILDYVGVGGGGDREKDNHKQKKTKKKSKSSSYFIGGSPGASLSASASASAPNTRAASLERERHSPGMKCNLNLNLNLNFNLRNIRGSAGCAASALGSGAGDASGNGSGGRRVSIGLANLRTSSLPVNLNGGLENNLDVLDISYNAMSSVDREVALG